MTLRAVTLEPDSSRYAPPWPPNCNVPGPVNAPELVPPLPSITVPLCTSTVPPLSNKMRMSVVPVPADLRKVPWLLNVPSPKSGSMMASFWTSNTAPDKFVNSPSIKNGPVSVQVAVAAFCSVPVSSLNEGPLMAIPPLANVVPELAMVPPVQTNRPSMIRLPAPVSVPLFKRSTPSTKTVPAPSIVRVKKLSARVTAPLATSPSPSSSPNTVTSAVDSVTVYGPSSVMAAMSPGPGGFLVSQFLPSSQSPPAWLIQDTTCWPRAGAAPTSAATISNAAASGIRLHAVSWR